MKMDSKISKVPSSWAAVKLGDFVENEKGKKPKNESKAETASHSIPYIDIQAFEENVIRTWTDGVGCRLCYETDFLMVWDGSRSGLVGKGMNGALGSTLVRIYFPSMVNDYAFYFLQSKYQQINTRAKGVGIPHVDPALLWNYDFPIAPLNEQHRLVAKIEELFSELDKGIENLKTARAQLKVYRQALLKHAFEGRLTAQWRKENQGKLETAEALLKRIQQERTQRYQQQLADWENKSPSIPLLQRGKTTSAASSSVPPFEKGGLGGISKPKAPKPLPPLTAEELAEFPELPEGWAYTRVGALIDDPTYGTSRKCDYEVEGIGVLRIPNVISGKVDASDLKFAQFTLDESATYKLSVGDILIIRSNGSVSIVGRCALVSSADVDYLYAGYLIRLRPHLRLVEPGFLLNTFSLHSVRKQIEQKAKSTSGVNNINTGEIQSLVVALCGIEEQKQIQMELESRLSEVDQLEQTITTSLQQAETLRQSILKKAFSGQLVAQDANDEPASALLARIKAEKAAQTTMAKPRKSKQVAAAPAPTKSNVIPFPVKIPNISATDLHAGILALAYQHHAQDKSNLVHFGHVKIEKIAHLVEAHLGIDLEREPIKDAAGPNDYPHLMKVESRARKANWFDVRKKKDADAYVFSKRHGFDALLLKTMHALGERADEVDALISLLVPMNKQQVEIVATLYAAWNNLLLLGQSPSDEEIVYEARENWHEAKLKIERKRFFIALGWMRQKGLVPAGNGRHVGKKK